MLNEISQSWEKTNIVWSPVHKLHKIFNYIKSESAMKVSKSLMLGKMGSFYIQDPIRKNKNFRDLLSNIVPIIVRMV
jgi:hypothetical protein